MKLQLVKSAEGNVAGYNLIPENMDEVRALGSIRNIYFWCTGDEGMTPVDAALEKMKYHGIETDETDHCVTKMKFIQKKYTADYYHEQKRIEQGITVHDVYNIPGEIKYTPPKKK